VNQVPSPLAATRMRLLRRGPRKLGALVPLRNCRGHLRDATPAGSFIAAIVGDGPIAAVVRRNCEHLPSAFHRQIVGGQRHFDIARVNYFAVAHFQFRSVSERQGATGGSHHSPAAPVSLARPKAGSSVHGVGGFHGTVADLKKRAGEEAVHPARRSVRAMFPGRHPNQKHSQPVTPCGLRRQVYRRC
jgi:hypothetical protein